MGGSLGAVRCHSAYPAPSSSPPLQLIPSPLPAPRPPRQRAPFRRCPTSRPLGVPSRAPPAGIARGAGSLSRAGLRPAPDFPRSDFSSTKHRKRKKEHATSAAGGTARLAWAGGDAQRLRRLPVSARGWPQDWVRLRCPRKGHPDPGKDKSLGAKAASTSTTTPRSGPASAQMSLPWSETFCGKTVH